jgi:tRNA-splicing endonuclease subunit Sen34
MQQVAASNAKSANKSTHSGRAMTEAAIRKRREREEKRRLEGPQAAMASSPTESPQSLFLPSIDQSPHSETPRSVRGTSTQSYTITIPASSTALPWCTQSRAGTYATIESAKAADIWNYPSNLHERAMCGVYKSLWDQGFFMGSGIKFGGDYLVYPGLSLFDMEYIYNSLPIFSKVIHYAFILISLSPSWTPQCLRSDLWR